MKIVYQCGFTGEEDIPFYLADSMFEDMCIAFKVMSGYQNINGNESFLEFPTQTLAVRAVYSVWNSAPKNKAEKIFLNDSVTYEIANTILKKFREQ